MNLTSNQDSAGSSEMSILNRLPVVVILGATGTGKSKLAAHLARKVGGEVISADSMQVYKGLDILTNKMTTEEMNSVPHHMISVVKPSEKFDVTCFRKQALPILEEILSKGKIPFIVGGTNYYIESLLWEVLIENPSIRGDSSSNSRKRKLEDKPEKSEPEVKMIQWDNEILSLFTVSNNYEVKEEDLLSRWTPIELHAALRLVDDERASRLHPNDIRKVIRSIQVFFQTGQKHSELISNQKQKVGNEEKSGGEGTADESMHLGGPLRFANSFCLWIRTPKEVLDARIEERVDQMVAKGLRQELNSYFEELVATKQELNFTQGLLQSIGFKEFHSYLQISPEDRDKEEVEKHFKDGLMELKLVTKRYARKQLKWINQRFLRPARRQVPPVYWLDCMKVDAGDWDEGVVTPSERILEARLSDKEDDPILLERRVLEKDLRDDDFVLRTCSICERDFMGKVQWDAHMKSRKHRLVVKKHTNIAIKDLALLETKS